MVKYPAMRGEGSNTYFAELLDGTAQAKMGYSLCMLRPSKVSLSSYYRDPYLLAITHELENRGVVEDELFSGYEDEPRRLPLTETGATIRCVPAGFELAPPPTGHEEVFAAICSEVGADEENLVKLPQAEVEGQWVDTVGRIQAGANIVRRLAAAGL